MERWIKTSLRQAAWAPLLVYCLYLVAALGFDAYRAYPWIDIPSHFFGGMAICYFFRAGLICAEEWIGRIPYPIAPALALGLTTITAVLWEFFEYLSDMLLGTHMNFGVADTLSDLFFGMLGGLCAIAIGEWKAGVRMTAAKAATAATAASRNSSPFR